MNRTPNTPANGGQIIELHQALTDLLNWSNPEASHSSGYLAALQRAHKAVFDTADLRASLAAPAIPTVDRFPAHAAVTPMFLLNAAMCIESPHEVATSRKREVLASLHRVADELQGKRMAAVEALPDVAQPAAQVALTEDEQFALMVKVEDYMDAIDWAGTQIHAKCDAAEAAIFAKVKEFISCRATPATVKTAESRNQLADVADYLGTLTEDE